MCFKPSGEPHAVYQGSYLVPILAEALAIPTTARLDRISEFLRFGPVTFDTLVLHTGSGDIVPLSTYFNRHLTKLDELNDLFYGHRTQEDGIVLSQGLGLNEQELEMRSILVRVQQELLKAAVHTRQRQETNLQEEQQASPAQCQDLVVVDECKKQGVEGQEEEGVVVKVVVEQTGQEQGETGKEEVVEEARLEEKQAGLEKEEQEEIVELENLMRANFLVVADELEQDSEELEQDSEEAESDP